MDDVDEERMFPAPQDSKEWDELKKDLDINPDLPAEEQELIYALIYKYRHLFSTGVNDLGRCKTYKHRIITEDVHPIKQRPYSASGKKAEAIQEEVDRLLSRIFDLLRRTVRI